MTEQTQPTDALAKLRHLYANMINGGVQDAASAKRIAEGLLSPAIEALEKWGTPAGAGEVVAWGIFDSQGFYEAASDQESAERFCAHYNKRKGADPLKPYTAKPLTTPQPTQAQAGAAPLPQYRVLEPRVDIIEAGDEYLQDDAQTWATDPNGTFVGTLYGYALRAARRRIVKKEGADHG